MLLSAGQNAVVNLLVCPTLAQGISKKLSAHVRPLIYVNSLCVQDAQASI